MLVLILIIMAVMIFFTFGQLTIDWLTPRLHLPNQIGSLISTVKWPVTIITVWFLLTMLYYFVPTAWVKLRYVWIGGLVSTIGLLLLSQGFTYYVRYFANSITTYKTIGTFIVLMFWLDFSALILLFGGVVNATVQELKDGSIREQSDAIARVMKRGAQRIRKNK